MDGDNAKVRLGTGYLNLQKEVFRELMNVKHAVHLLTSSPKANGFYKGGRVKKYIPGVYRVNELNMLHEYSRLAKKPDDFGIFEFLKGDWTFHGKGAWLYEDASTDSVDLTVIGSSNFSYRSNRRDTECQLYIVPECASFKRRLHQEAEYLFASATEVDTEIVKNGGEPLGYQKLTWREKMLNKIAKDLI